MRRLSLLVALCMSFTAYGDTDAFVESIEQAHGKAAWYSQQAVQAEVEIYFGDQLKLAGTMTFDPWVGRSRIETTDGKVMVFDGQQAYVSPKDAADPMARFHLLTWPYFLALPFKLSDPGVNLQMGDDPDRARMTFDAGTGDAPDDWYVLYRDPQTHRLNAAAYIVTYFGPAEEAEKEPHVIVYENWQTVDGATVSTNWTFHHWSEAEGIYGEPIGRASVSGVRFVAASAEMFARPVDAAVAPGPGETGE